MQWTQIRGDCLESEDEGEALSLAGALCDIFRVPVCVMRDVRIAGEDTWVIMRDGPAGLPEGCDLVREFKPGPWTGEA